MYQPNLTQATFRRPIHPVFEAGHNKKVVGMFKDEAGGEIIEEFVGLRAKMYSYKMLDNEKEEEEVEEEEEDEEKKEKTPTVVKKCKGIKKSVVKRSIHFEDYKKCLFTGEE